MKALLLVAALALAAPSAHAAGSHRVKGYTTKSGTYVSPTRRTNPDGRLPNNYSSKPNVNPYSGRVGTVDPYAPKPPRPKAPRF